MKCLVKKMLYNYMYNYGAILSTFLSIFDQLSTLVSMFTKYTVGKTVTKKKFWILDFFVLVNSLDFK